MYQIHRQDVIEWAKEYQGPKFHAMITDTPYHLTSITKRFGKDGSAPAKGDVYRRASAGMMGQRWDGLGESGKGISFDPATWAALSQHLYPGAFIMAFGGSRGYHRMATAMEDAGLIIHPAMGWLTLSGFPKATRIDTQLDKAAGNTRPDKLNGGHIGMGKSAGDDANENELQNRVPHIIGKGNHTNGAPIDPLAQTWQSHRYGLQALKPAFEFIAVAQVPYSGRPVDSIVATGSGALNIEGGRIPTENKTPFPVGTQKTGYNGGFPVNGDDPSPAARWPANFILQHSPLDNGTCHESCPVRLFDEQAGESTSTGGTGETTQSIGGRSAYQGGDNRGFFHYGDSGPASRMFFQADFSYEVAEQLASAEPVRYEPKVSSSEREAGLDGFPGKKRDESRNAAQPSMNGGEGNPYNRGVIPVRNNHPTLKPISLTKYLATLLLPPAAYAPRRILVPFSGVASEMAGCVLAGWESVTGIESNAAYAEIGEARLAWWSQWPGWGQTDVDAILAAAKEDDTGETGQLSLFSKPA